MLRTAILLCALIQLATPRQLHAARAKGIDVSVYQGDSVNWDSVAGSGRSFAWARATEGHGYTDPTFPGNVANAKAAGVLIGAYHYCRPDLNFGPAGAALEAQHFWNAIRTHMATNVCLMPACDIERYPNDTFTYTKTTLSRWVNAWCSNVVALAAADGFAVKPFVYSYISCANTWFNATTVDNGAKFCSKALDAWAYQRGVKLDFIRPGKPVENGFIESFNGKVRDECLDT